MVAVPLRTPETGSLGYRLSLDLRRYRNKSYAEMEIADSSPQLGLGPFSYRLMAATEMKNGGRGGA
jgi:hypothetical protein